MVRHFEQELETLKIHLIKMESLVDEQPDAACRALFDGNLELAPRVIQHDVEVDVFNTSLPWSSLLLWTCAC